MDKLHEVDFLLAQLEDTAHGEESKKVGMARKLISELSASNDAKPNVIGCKEFIEQLMNKLEKAADEKKSEFERHVLLSKIGDLNIALLVINEHAAL